MTPLVLLFYMPIIIEAWEQNSLQCWQCAAVPGYSTQCPQDAVLYELPEWNACMVWTLDHDKRVVLQNFVYSHSDCTKEKLDYWSDYIFKVWRQPGSAKCCFDVSTDSNVPYRKENYRLFADTTSLFYASFDGFQKFQSLSIL